MRDPSRRATNAFQSDRDTHPCATQVAHQLGISEKTVKVRRGRVYEKMEADSFVALVDMALELGIRPVSPSTARAC